MDEWKKEQGQQLRVGIVGAGIGGLMAAIAISRAGAQVTVLEAAEELGEIGAGIQMTPNVARLLRRYGVDKEIGDDLVGFKALCMRKAGGERVGYTSIKRVEDAAGERWWLVHRHHLHQGLVATAKKNGCILHIDSRITSLSYSDTTEPVSITTHQGLQYSFDLLLGSDGINGITRRVLFPSITPTPPTNNSAYRAIVPYDRLLTDPLTRSLVKPGLSMDVWMGSQKYIISYPISDGRDFNMVLSHHTTHPVTQAQDVSLQEVKDTYKEFDPRIRRVIEMIDHPIQRWPLLVTGPLDSWTSTCKRVVLMGDAAHSMTNHMAQGAATAMEDGAFLGVVIKAVLQQRLSLSSAIRVYENERMPKVKWKQEVSFLNGWIWHLDGEEAERRNEAMKGELEGADEGSVLMRSPNLYGDPVTVRRVYGYDAEAHAERAVGRALGSEEAHVQMGWRKNVRMETWDEVAGWFIGDKSKKKARL